MIGTVHWIPFAVVFAAFLVVAFVWLRGRRADGQYILEQRTVRCRARGNQLAALTLVRDAATKEPIGVRSCSLSNPVDDVRCGKDCLHFFETPKKAEDTAAACPAELPATQA